MDSCVIFSFYHKSTPGLVVDHHKAVFGKFGIPIVYIETDGLLTNATHATNIDKFVRENPCDYYILFDVDAIPLNASVVPFMLDQVRDKKTLFGPAQQSNHILKPNGTFCHIYAAPSAMAFSREVLEELGTPSFMPTDRGDTAEELTWIVEEEKHRHNVKLKLIWPTAYEQQVWYVGNMPYGYGTTYSDEKLGPMVYHAFHISAQITCELFLRKCQQVMLS